MGWAGEIRSTWRPRALRQRCVFRNQASRNRSAHRVDKVVGFGCDPMRDMLNGGTVFAGLGVLLAVGAFVGFVRRRALLATWTRAPGVVVSYRVRQTRRNGRRRTFYHPLIRYEAAGREWIHEMPIGSNHKGRAVGEPVPLLFDPKQPQEACVDGVRERYFVSLVVGAIGVVFTATGTWLLTLPQR